MSLRPGLRVVLSSLALAAVAVCSVVVPGPAMAPVAARTGHLDAFAPVSETSRSPRDVVGPRTGALFSRPGQHRIRDLVVDHLRRSPEGGLVRVVVWTYDSARLTDELLRAARHGVRVRVLVGGISCGEPAFERLSRSLPASSLARCVRGSARSTSVFDGLETNLHQKSWTFSQVGAARWVSVVTTANATAEADLHQYNDAYQFVGHRLLYRRLGQMFDQQSRDRPMPRPYRRFALGDGEAVTFLPWNSPGQQDPVVARIRSLRGVGTRILVAQSNWQDSRGVRIARALVGRHRAGAEVRVLASLPMGRAVRAVLRDGGIHVESAWFGPNRYSHLKFMAAEYDGNGGRVSRLWTGSENWWSPSRGHDELVVQISDPRAHTAYARFFHEVWSDS